MKFKLKALTLCLLSFLFVSNAYSHTCDFLPYDPERTSKLERDRAVANALYEEIKAREDGSFFVYGQFAKRTDLPLVHDLDINDRSKRILENGYGNEVFANITYSYFDEFSFSGTRIVNGKEEPFSTDKTIIEINIIEGYAQGQVPPLGKKVIGRMKKKDRFRYETKTGFCQHFHEVKKRPYRLLKKSIKAGRCPWKG